MHVGFPTSLQFIENVIGCINVVILYLRFSYTSSFFIINWWTNDKEVHKLLLHRIKDRS